MLTWVGLVLFLCVLNMCALLIEQYALAMSVSFVQACATAMMVSEDYQRRAVDVSWSGEP